MKIDLTKILKPGDSIWSPVKGVLKVKRIHTSKRLDNKYVIECDQGLMYTCGGKFHYPDKKPSLFPSEELYWENRGDFEKCWIPFFVKAICSNANCQSDLLKS